MKYILKVYSIWEIGQRKDSFGNPHQEDSLFPEFGKQSDTDRLFILCDGMGGHDAGEIASNSVCEAMSRSILNNGHDNDGVFSVEDFHAAINAAFNALDEKDSGAEKKMGTTMTFLKLHNKGAFIAHIGDSRVYHIRPGKDGSETQILFETRDHSLINDLIKIGELTKEEARHSKQKNVITRAMQPNVSRKPKADIYQTADIKPGDYFYMCSDGMLEQYEMEDGTSLRNIFSHLGGDDENKVKILKSVTEKNRDNHTAFIIHIIDVQDATEENLTDASLQESESDKFVAIIEEDDYADITNTGESSAEKQESTETSPDKLNDKASTESLRTTVISADSRHTKQLTTYKKNESQNNHKLLLSWGLAILTIMAIMFFCMNGVRSCYADNHDKNSENLQNSNKQNVKAHKQKKKNSHKPHTPKQNTQEVQNGNTAVQTANAPISDSLTSNEAQSQHTSATQKPTNTQQSSNTSIQLLQEGEVVSSDVQVIQDNS